MGSTLPPSVKWPDVDEKDIKITMRDGFVNRARIYSPLETGSEGRPLLVTVYGGGWVMGKLENEEKNCRSWVRKWGGVAVALEHRRVLYFMKGGVVLMMVGCVQRSSSRCRWKIVMML